MSLTDSWRFLQSKQFSGAIGDEQRHQGRARRIACGYDRPDRFDRNLHLLHAEAARTVAETNRTAEKSSHHQNTRGFRMNRTTISIDENQLEALNSLVSSGISVFGDHDTLATVVANDWLVAARQALVASQEVG